MCPAPRSEPGWRPTASLERLRRRAEILSRVRAFFALRGVLEVDTPLLSAATVTDLHLRALETTVTAPGLGRRRAFLQTSPEYAMKRLLAAGSGPIYQMCKAFRDEEAGRRHNPEFTMLEWYRPGFDHHALMDEMDALLHEILDTSPAERLSYAEAFSRHAGIDPHRATVEELRRAARDAGIEMVESEGWSPDRDDWLHLLGSHRVEPKLGFPAGPDSAAGPGSGKRRPTFLYDYPASQAALARIRPGAEGTPSVAERFEVYIEGVELANGFHELADAAEQRRRFEADRRARRLAGLPQPEADEHLLAALDAGLPDCAGVALGVDRLVMLATGAEHIDEVIPFPFERA